MTRVRLAPNALAFVGPAHVSTLSGFCYVRVQRVEGDKAVVCVVGPDSDSDEQEIEVPVSVLELRVVDSSEVDLWPGDYVGYPVVFVQNIGPCTGQWAYGAATRYEVSTGGTSLSVIVGSDVISVRLQEPLQIIKADPITYALQVGATVSDMILNPKELLQQQNTVIAACRKRRGEIPASVRLLLTVPFVPNDLVALVRPHDLSVVKVRRQHILDCLMGARKKSSLDIYKDPQGLAEADEVRASVSDQPARRRTDEDLLSVSSGSDTDDIGEIQQQNRVLGKRSRMLESARQVQRELSRGNAFNSDGVSSDDELEPARAAFRPSALSVGLVEPFFIRDFKAQDSNISFTYFSERNTLRSAAPATSRADVSSALRALLVFARHFYNQAVVDLIDAASAFLDSYKGVADTDAVGWKLLAFWVTNKFSKFRGFIVARDLDAAQEVRFEFSRTDEELLEILDLRRSRRSGEHSTHGARPGQDDSRHPSRPPRKSSIPANVLAALPRQGHKRLCMKAISVVGCSGDGRGGCFDRQRAHFHPNTLPEVVKTYIVENYKGLTEEKPSVKPEA
ncbi:hypothetical protein PF003_g33254 [Phytophthora fragariae]|nr:hypothetical protein PF003_g33254 [Phytophthora fragariae]